MRSAIRILRQTRYLLILSIICLYQVQPQAQRNCGTDEHWQSQIEKDPTLEQRKLELEQEIQRIIRKNRLNPDRSAVVITIPVVFHILYNDSADDSTNISDDQILSQIEVLNEDFRGLNADIDSVPPPFSSLTADMEIEFCLAAVDPNGNPTSGITRTLTSKVMFSSATDDAKFTDMGGMDAWDRDSYLNFWVVPQLIKEDSSAILGYAQFPGGAAETDGIVVRFLFVGRTPHNPFATAFNLGRTGTHEVGHWLDLIHIWGGGGCLGTDHVDDTPNQDGPNYGCPAFPLLDGCTGEPPGVMFMNYMDYVNDDCMVMFSEGQKERSRAVLESSRASLMTSAGCCPNDWEISGDVDHPNNYVRASSHIAATNATVSSTDAAVLQAGSYVDMKVGFQAQSGCDFIAVLQPCDSLSQDTKVTHD